MHIRDIFSVSVHDTVVDPLAAKQEEKMLSPPKPRLVWSNSQVNCRYTMTPMSSRALFHRFYSATGEQVKHLRACAGGAHISSLCACAQGTAKLAQKYIIGA